MAIFIQAEMKMEVNQLIQYKQIMFFLLVKWYQFKIFVIC